MKEKEIYFYERTFAHIHRVQNNALYLAMECWDELGLQEWRIPLFLRKVMTHDVSKFESSQRKAYIDFTWSKKHGLELSEEQKERFRIAWEDHQVKERHHPLAGMLHTFDAIVEMACDLQAMAQERGDGSGRPYFEKVWMVDKEDRFEEGEWPGVVELMSKCFDCFERREVE